MREGNHPAPIRTLIGFGSVRLIGCSDLKSDITHPPPSQSAAAYCISHHVLHNESLVCTRSKSEMFNHDAGESERRHANFPNEATTAQYEKYPFT